MQDILALTGLTTKPLAEQVGYVGSSSTTRMLTLMMLPHEGGGS